jgi:pyruvate dehydrogenase E2 component (dihydrolipoamide acetyltransferase)
MGNVIVMPQLGLTMTEGTVSTWLKKPGDRVEKDEIIVAVATDKVDMDVESTVTGVIREIVVAEGETVPVGTVLAYLEGAETAPNKSAPTSEASTKTVEQTASQAQRVEAEAAGMAGVTEVARASPRAKKKARELGIDLSTVRGSGPGGRIVEEDLVGLKLDGQAVTAQRAGNQRRRQIIADRMLESIRTIPSFSLTTEINVEKLVALYESIQDPIRASSGCKLTYTDLLVKALGIAVSKSPAINSKWIGNDIQKRTEDCIAIAVATDTGVIAPSLKNISRLPLQEIVSLRNELTLRARSGKLTAEDFGEDISGTISNLGMYRIDRFEGLITPGQTFLLSVGQLRKRPWADSTVSVKPTLVLTLSVDHRIADGAEAAMFLQNLVEVLSSPEQRLWQGAR